MDDVKVNFNSLNMDATCDLCSEDVVQDTAHLLLCQTLIDNCPELYDDSIVEYEDIFKETDHQLNAVKLFSKIFKTKNSLVMGNE